ncbi:MAG: hypothetical protein WAZ27_02985 [Minisyncoccia bacterium]
MNSIPVNSEYIPASRAAKQSFVTADYVTKLCRAGLVPGKRENGLWLVDYSFLRAYLSEKAAGKEVWKQRQAERRRAEQRAAGFESRAVRRQRILTRYALPAVSVAPVEVRLHAELFAANSSQKASAISPLFVTAVIATGMFFYSTSFVWPSIPFPDSKTFLASVEASSDFFMQIFEREIMYTRSSKDF